MSETSSSVLPRKYKKKSNKFPDFKEGDVVSYQPRRMRFGLAPPPRKAVIKKIYQDGNCKITFTNTGLDKLTALSTLTAAV